MSATSHEPEMVRVMPPLKTIEIEGAANEVLRQVAPSHLRAPGPLDVCHLVDYELQKFGIHVSPVDDSDLPGAHAMALFRGNVGDDIDVIVSETEWDHLTAGGRRAHHARGSVAHEIGHAVLHVNVVRRRRALGLGLPRQAKIRDVPSFRNAEWQAWCFGTCLLAPRRTILMAGTLDVGELARIYHVSEGLMALHLKRLKLVRASTRSERW